MKKQELSSLKLINSLIKIESQLEKVRGCSPLTHGWQTQKYASASRSWDNLAKRKFIIMQSIETLIDSGLEKLTVLEKPNGYELIIMHVESGSAYGVDISKAIYEQLRAHFSLESPCSCTRGKGVAYDENGLLYCIDCGKNIIEKNNTI